jgi:hypothetical protein
MKRKVHRFFQALVVVMLMLSLVLVAPPTVQAQTLSLSPTSGAPGTGITISGSAFTPSAAGWVWFDSDGDSVKDATEPQVPVTTTAAGDIPSGTTLAIPTVTPGIYQVRADIPSGAPVEASTGFTVLPTPSITLSPTSGMPGTGITISGSAFTPSTAGWVWFDSNGDSVRDATEPQVSVTATAAGAIPSGTTLAIPTVNPGIYQVRADIPSGGSVEAAANFTVPPIPSITLSPTSGASSTVITITGSGFVPNTAGWVWFDSDGDSVIDVTEPQASVITTGAGAIPGGIILTVPAVVPGTYGIRADIPSGAPVEASTSFTVPSPSITLSPTSGVPGTVITITGSGFAISTAGWVWFDSDGSGALDPGEPWVAATTTAAGAIPAGIILTVPAVIPSTYLVWADIPVGVPVEAAASFTVPSPSITLSPTSGVPGTVITITGSSFAPNTAGVVGFDSNGNNVIDLGEPQVTVTTTAAGAIPGGTILAVPVVAPPNIYPVLADIPVGMPLEDSASFTVPSPNITLSPTSGVPGTVITITGSGFAPNTAAWVWFDSDGSGALDPGEPQVAVITTAAGAIPAGIILMVPAVVPGTHLVRADIPFGVPVEAAASFTVPSPSITLSPTSGVPGTVITITGSSFAPNTAGVVGFDSNGDGVIDDPGEPQVTVITTAAGAIPGGTILSVPPVAAGGYRVLADIPLSGSVEAAASFTVPSPSVTLSPTSGVPDTVITITGSGFASNIAGAVGFDSNGSGAIDPGEPQVSVATTAAGAITAGTILTVPAVPAGVYQVLADIPVGVPVEASASFTVLVRAITLSPVSGAPGTVITITGSGFAPNTAGVVGFDSDGSGAIELVEPRVSVTTTGAGAIPAGITLAVPAVAPGTYPVLADIPSSGSVEASANFTLLVRAIALSPVSGTSGTVITITGSGFAPNTVGAVGFDSDGSGAIELVEPRVSVTTTDAGFIPTGVTLTVPAVAAGVYQVLADIPVGVPVEAAASFTVVLPPSPEVLLGSARGEIILAPGASVDVIAPSASPFMGTIGIQSTGLRYNVDIWNVTVWATVVAAGARNASYPVSGFGLRITNDTTTTMTISYVVVYMSN